MAAGLLRKKYTLIIIVYLLSVFNCFGTDPLDLVPNTSKLTRDLKDIYRAFAINHKIDEQKEFINIYLDSSTETELNNTLSSYIEVCEALKQTHFFNDTLGALVSKYLTGTIQNYKVARANGFGSVVFKKDYKKYNTVREKYMSYLETAYTTKRFVDLSEKKYWQLNDEKNYIKSANYPEYEKLRKTNLKASLSVLEKIATQTTDFQEWSIYEIEIADHYVRHFDDLGDNATEIAIAKYKGILDKKKYSIYLFEAWLKWRTVTQQNNGLSKTSDIPNDKYNKMREQVALNILNYVSSNPNDKMAINEFLLMATHDIVKRFGAYQFGNQNTIEYHEIFDDKK